MGIEKEEQAGRGRRHLLEVSDHLLVAVRNIYGKSFCYTLRGVFDLPRLARSSLDRAAVSLLTAPMYPLVPTKNFSRSSPSF